MGGAGVAEGSGEGSGIKGEGSSSTFKIPFDWDESMVENAPPVAPDSDGAEAATAAAMAEACAGIAFPTEVAIAAASLGTTAATAEAMAAA